MQNKNISFKIVSDSFPTLERPIKQYDAHCVTYLIHNNKQLYIGESSNLRSRFKDHNKSKEEHKLKSSQIIISDYFNKSAVYDIETKLINFMFADNKFELINRKTKQSSHQYFMKREMNEHVFRGIWKELMKRGLARDDLETIENSSLFKYSPYKEFSEEQLKAVDSIIKTITEPTEEILMHFDGSSLKRRKLKCSVRKGFIIEGSPGTGKSLLVIKLIQDLIKTYGVDLTVAVCIPQTSLRSTFKKLMRQAKLKVKVIKPIDMSKDIEEKYDLLIIDEAHRLKQYFGRQAKDLKHLDKGRFNELDFAKKKSKNLILMYDSKQTVRPADIPKNFFENTNFKKFKLSQQFRVLSNGDYLEFIKSLLQMNGTTPDPAQLGGYNLKLIDCPQKMQNLIKAHNKDIGLSRMCSGYFIKWQSKKQPNFLDFKGIGLKAKWNSTLEGWVNKQYSVDEVGCIHTLQGVDLNYAGVIIGDDIYYDTNEKKINISSQNYKDINGTPIRGTDINDVQLTEYIKNIYYVLLTRGIYGTYIYVRDKNLREYLQKYIN